MEFRVTPSEFLLNLEDVIGLRLSAYAYTKRILESWYPEWDLWLQQLIRGT